MTQVCIYVQESCAELTPSEGHTAFRSRRESIPRSTPKWIPRSTRCSDTDARSRKIRPRSRCTSPTSAMTSNLPCSLTTTKLLREPGGQARPAPHRLRGFLGCENLALRARLRQRQCPVARKIRRGLHHPEWTSTTHGHARRGSQGVLIYELIIARARTIP